VQEVCKGSGHMKHAGALKAGVLTSGEVVGNEAMLSKASIGRSSLDYLRPGMDSARNSRNSRWDRTAWSPTWNCEQGTMAQKGKSRWNATSLNRS